MLSTRFPLARNGEAPALGLLHYSDQLKEGLVSIIF